MVFKIQHSVPANTTIEDPDWQKLKIMKGVLTQWILFQPEECADLMQFRVEYQGHPVLPFTSHEWMYGFFVTTPIFAKLKIDGAPYELDIYAFNDDDRNSHEYNIYVVVDPPSPVTPEELDEDTEKMLEELLGGA